MEQSVKASNKDSETIETCAAEEVCVLKWETLLLLALQEVEIEMKLKLLLQLHIGSRDKITLRFRGDASMRDFPPFTAAAIGLGITMKNTTCQKEIGQAGQQTRFGI